MDPGRRAELRQRALLTAAIVVFYALGYFAVGWGVDPARARSLETALDARIPFIPETVFLYAWVYSAMLFPLFAVRSQALFRRVALAYVSVVGVSLVVFAAWPVGSAGLRADVASLDPARFADWGVAVIYTIDPPFNLFPSLHLSIATMAALAAWKARPAYGAIGFLWVLAIAGSVCTVKQHYAVDGVGGFAVAMAAYAAILRPYRRASPEESAYGWGGMLLFAAFHVFFYAVAYAVFRAGVRPLALGLGAG